MNGEVRMLTSIVKRALRSLGVDVRRYNPQASESAMLRRLFATYAVDCVFDVGANTGQYARSLRAMGFGGRVISFEPLADAHSLLLANSRRDPDWIVAPRMALGDSDGETDIHVAANASSSSILDMMEAHERAAPASKYIRTERTRIATLDSVFPTYVGDATRPLLKIDTQGYEARVIAGAASCIDRFVGIQAEMSLIELYRGQALLLDFALAMRHRGFELTALFPVLTDNQSGRLLQVDGVFFR